MDVGDSNLLETPPDTSNLDGTFTTGDCAASSGGTINLNESFVIHSPIFSTLRRPFGSGTVNN
jgi:hypothetical protein